MAKRAEGDSTDNPTNWRNKGTKWLSPRKVWQTLEITPKHAWA